MIIVVKSTINFRSIIMEKKDNQSIVAVSEKFQTLNEKELSKIIGGDVRRTQFWNLFPRK